MGPTRPATPHTPPITPCIRARSCNVKMSPTSVSAIDCIAPPPMPWIVRKPMSHAMPVERPQATDASKNTKMPPIRMRFRPYTSASLPKMGTPTVDDST